MRERKRQSKTEILNLLTWFIEQGGMQVKRVKATSNATERSPGSA